MEPFVRDAAVIVISPVLVWASVLSSVMVRRLYLPQEEASGWADFFREVQALIFRKSVLVPVCLLGLLLSFLFTQYMVSKVLACVIFGAGLYTAFAKPPAAPK